MGKRLVLILGGTNEAAALAEALAAKESWAPVTSLAGRTTARRKLVGEVRVGGFGGVDGLVAWLEEHRPHAVVDATHPFARQMPHHAAKACALVSLPRLRLVRPMWERDPEDRWVEVADAEEAARVLPNFGKTAFLSTANEALPVFLGLADRMRLVLRTIEPLTGLPAGVVALQARPPFTPEEELELFRRYGVDVLVTKASGGPSTVAKIHAARQLSVPVLMLRRPPLPHGPLVQDIEGAVDWLARLGA